MSNSIGDLVALFVAQAAEREAAGLYNLASGVPDPWADRYERRADFLCNEAGEIRRAIVEPDACDDDGLAESVFHEMEEWD
jgi:hypothetical protein